MEDKEGNTLLEEKKHWILQPMQKTMETRFLFHYNIKIEIMTKFYKFSKNL